jgi:LacI family transcriptional regulator
VSKALNDHNDISEETKKRVKKVAGELGYFPNAAARALKTSRSYNIGVLFEEHAEDGLTHEYLAGVFTGFRIRAEKLGYDITFINSGHEGKRISYYEHCRYRNFDGVVIVRASFENPEVTELMGSDLPVVTIDYVHHNCTAICSNNIQGMEELIKYIFSHGHRKIAYIHGQEGSSVTRDRLTSYYRTLEELGLPTHNEYVRRADDLEVEGTAEQTKELLNLPDPPTCIIYPDDASLLVGRRIIGDMGLRVPEDISIAGYDGTRVSRLLCPELTTVCQNCDLIGSEAAERLIGIIEKPKTAIVERVVIEGILVPGQSVGTVRA